MSNDHEDIDQRIIRTTVRFIYLLPLNFSRQLHTFLFYFFHKLIYQDSVICKFSIRQSKNITKKQTNNQPTDKQTDRQPIK